MNVGQLGIKTLKIQELLFADEMILIGDSEFEKRNILVKLEQIDMKVNEPESKTMTIAELEQKHKKYLNAATLEQVRMGKAGKLYNALKNTFLRSQVN